MSFLVMLTRLKAINLATSCTGYLNKWDGRLYWSAGRNRFVTGVYSKNDKIKKDRRWAFCHGHATGVTTSDCFWTRKLNDYDKKIHYTCRTNYAVSGFYSYHDNRREDRRWSVKCCKVQGASVIDAGWSTYKNHFHTTLKFKCGYNQVVTGIYSVHSNHWEDRRWRIRCAKLQADIYHLQASLSGYINSWKGVFSWDAGMNEMITGFKSYHHDRKDDRKWRVYHGSINLRCDKSLWSGYANNWDGYLKFVCPNRAVLSGVSSYYHYVKKDRRWKFSCCTLPTNVAVKRHGYKLINQWGARMDWSCSKSNEAVYAIESSHNNNYEDRQWKIACGEIVKK